MAISSQHVDRLIPWLLEGIEADPRLDEVGWSINAHVLPTEQGTQLIWLLILSTINPLLGQPALVYPMFVLDFFPGEPEFKGYVVEGLNALVAIRQTILTGTGQQGPNGHPLS